MDLALLGRWPGTWQAFFQHNLLGRLPDSWQRPFLRRLPPEQHSVWWCREGLQPFKTVIWKVPGPAAGPMDVSDLLLQKTALQAIRSGAGFISPAGTLAWRPQLDVWCGSWGIARTNGLTATATCLAMGFGSIEAAARRNAECVVQGADLPLGAVVARLIAPHARFLTLAGTNERAMDRLALHILHESGVSPRVRRLDEPVGVAVGIERDGTLMPLGGTGEVPTFNGMVPMVNAPDGFLTGLEAGTSLTRLSPGAAEGVLLMLEKRPEGVESAGVTVEGAYALQELAQKHGFRMGAGWVPAQRLAELDNGGTTEV